MLSVKGTATTVFLTFHDSMLATVTRCLKVRNTAIVTEGRSLEAEKKGNPHNHHNLAF